MGALAAELAGLQGRDDVLTDEVTHLRRRAQHIGDRRRMATLDRAVGLHALAHGRLDEAVASLAAAADVPFLGRGLRDAVLPARGDLVETLVRLGRTEEARIRAAALSDLLSAMDDPLARALDLRAQALSADGADAEELLRAALAAHQEAHDPFEEARTQLLLGEHLRRDRQRSAARTCLLTAQRTFEQLDAAPWLHRTQTELRAAGGQPRASAGLEVLTPQERAVAEAVASGRSNREVAEELFLSPRTVEYHLGSVYRKLGVHGRSALAHRWRRPGPRRAAGRCRAPRGRPARVSSREPVGRLGDMDGAAGDVDLPGRLPRLVRAGAAACGPGHRARSRAARQGLPHAALVHAHRDVVRAAVDDELHVHAVGEHVGGSDVGSDGEVAGLVELVDEHDRVRVGHQDTRSPAMNVPPRPPAEAPWPVVSSPCPCRS